MATDSTLLEHLAMHGCQKCEVLLNHWEGSTVMVVVQHQLYIVYGSATGCLAPILVCRCCKCDT
jgi:hypothetical protein